MRISINCRSFLKANYTGIGRYAFNLAEFLGKIDRDNEYFLYVQKGLWDMKRRIPRFPYGNYHVKRDFFNKGWQATVGAADIYHYPSPDEIPDGDARIIVTVHDLIYKAYPRVHSRDAVEKTDRFMHQAVQRAAKIICCSQSTREDLHRYFSVDRAKTCLIYQGVDKGEFYPLSGKDREDARDTVRQKGIDGPFILFVGTIEPRKNLSNLIRAVAILKNQKKFKGKLVVAGMKGWMNEGISGLIKQCRLENDVIFLGFVTNRELRCLYNLAEVFVFPSFYEGFGFPILEAFSCATAVVTSNAASCPEVAGDSALTVDPDAPKEIAEAVLKITEDQVLKEELRKKAFRRSGDFSFLKTAEETLNIYREVADRKT